MSEEWGPDDERFEDELRGLFGTVRVPPRLAWQQPAAAPPARARFRFRALPASRPRLAGWPRLAAAGLATALVAGGTAALVSVGVPGSPAPRPPAATSAPGTPTEAPTGAIPTPSLPDASTPPATGASGTLGGPGSPTGGVPGTSRSIPPPASTGWPGAANTGVPAGTALRRSGSVTANRAGQVISGLDVTGVIDVAAPNVTIRNTRVRSTDEWAVQLEPGASVTIEDCDLSGGHSSAIQEGDWRAYRVHIHDVPGDGVRLGSGSLLQDSYIHAVGSSGARMLSGGSNITLRHNTIDVPDASAALFLTPEGGPDGSGPVTVTGNLVGGGGWTVYVVTGQQGRYHQRGYTITGNRWLRDAGYGPVSITEDPSAFVAWTDNRYEDSGAAVPGP